MTVLRDHPERRPVSLSAILGPRQYIRIILNLLFEVIDGCNKLGSSQRGTPPTLRQRRSWFAKGPSPARASPGGMASCRPVLCAGAWLLLCLLAQGVAAQAPYRFSDARAQQGAYLGCFARSSSQFLWSKAANLGQWSIMKCSDYCKFMNMPLYAISRTYQCACSSLPPSPANRVSDAQCERIRWGNTTLALLPVFYVHQNTSATCRINNIKASKDNFLASYNPHNALYSTSGRTVELRLVGNDGVRLYSKTEMLYGMFSFKGKISDKPGVITAAYLRDDINDPSSNFSEIDFEYVNGHPCPEPGTVWLNSFHNGIGQGEHQVPPSVFRPLIKKGPTTTIASEWHTYSLDWQPGYLAWYMDGAMIMKEYYGVRNFTSPRVPLKIMLAIWTDSARNFEFGGTIDYSKAPFTSSLADLRQVVCDRPANINNGPSWVYADLISKGATARPAGMRALRATVKALLGGDIPGDTKELYEPLGES